MIENLGDKAGTGGFHNNPQNINKNGRPKRLVQLMKDKGYSKDDVKSTYASLADCSKADLGNLVKNKDATALEVSIARAFMKAMSKGEYRLIKDIVELFADKPKQSSEVSGPNGGPIRTKVIEEIDITNLPPETIETIMKALDKQTGIDE